MRLIVIFELLTQLSACVVYGNGEETGIITPLGTASSADDKETTET